MSCFTRKNASFNTSSRNNKEVLSRCESNSFYEERFSRISFHRLSTVFLNPLPLHSFSILSHVPITQRLSKSVVTFLRSNSSFKAPWRALTRETPFHPETVKICDDRFIPLSIDVISLFSSLPPHWWSSSNTHGRSPLHEIQLLPALPTFPRNPFSRKYVRSSLALVSSLFRVPFLSLFRVRTCATEGRPCLVKGICTAAEKKTRAYCHDEIRFTGKSW